MGRSVPARAAWQGIYGAGQSALKLLSFLDPSWADDPTGVPVGIVGPSTGDGGVLLHHLQRGWARPSIASTSGWTAFSLALSLHPDQWERPERLK